MSRSLPSLIGMFIVVAISVAIIFRVKFLANLVLPKSA